MDALSSLLFTIIVTEIERIMAVGGQSPLVEKLPIIYSLFTASSQLYEKVSGLVAKVESLNDGTVPNRS